MYSFGSTLMLCSPLYGSYFTATASSLVVITGPPHKDSWLFYTGIEIPVKSVQFDTFYFLYS